MLCINVWINPIFGSCLFTQVAIGFGQQPTKLEVPIAPNCLEVYSDVVDEKVCFETI